MTFIIASIGALYFNFNIEEIGRNAQSRAHNSPIRFVNINTRNLIDANHREARNVCTKLHAV